MLIVLFYRSDFPEIGIETQVYLKKNSESKALACPVYLVMTKNSINKHTPQIIQSLQVRHQPHYILTNFFENKVANQVGLGLLPFSFCCLPSDVGTSVFHWPKQFGRKDPNTVTRMEEKAHECVGLLSSRTPS